MLVDAHNGFHKLGRLAMLWTVGHLCPLGTRFAFNSYKHWAQLLLYHPGEPPFMLLIREGVTQGDLIYIFLYGITFVSLAKDIREADPGLLTPLYLDDAEFYGYERRSAQILKLLIERRVHWGYFPNLTRSLFSQIHRIRRKRQRCSLRRKV